MLAIRSAIYWAEHHTGPHQTNADTEVTWDNPAGYRVPGCVHDLLDVLRRDALVVREGRPAAAAAYVVASLVGGVALAAAGYAIAARGA